MFLYSVWGQIRFYIKLLGSIQKRGQFKKGSVQMGASNTGRMILTTYVSVIVSFNTNIHFSLEISGKKKQNF